MTRLGQRRPESALRRPAIGWRGCCPPDALEDALAGLEPEEITGPGGLMTQLAGRVMEAALGAELSEHLGYPPGEAPPGGAGNRPQRPTAQDAQDRARPGRRSAPRATATGTLSRSWWPSARPAWRAGRAGPGPLRRRHDDAATSPRTCSGLYGVEVGRDTISRVTDAVLEDIQAWRARPLEAVYPIVYFDALMSRSARTARSAPAPATWPSGSPATATAKRSGIWWQDSEGAKFWLAVLNDLNQRGVEDVLIACVDGLTGFPDAIEAVFPQAWVQTCIVHQIRSSTALRHLPGPAQVAADLRPIYRAANADHALAELDRFDEPGASATR